MAKKEGKSILDTPLSTLFSLNWERGLYALFLIIAILTRFWDLGSRAMSHDESLHALYSWKLYAGQGYIHNPMMHGPFLFHANALIYFLFGDSDYTARVVPALFGVVLVILPYFLRRWLGRTGALVTSALLLISPSFLYYSRYIRNDIYIAVWTMLMVIALFGYIAEHKSRYLYLGSAALSLSLCTKEVSYLTGFIGLTFILLAVVWEWVTDKREQPVLSALRSITPQALAVSILIFAVIFVLLYTTFFTNILGLASGTVGTLAYWLAQHGVQRGGQPWYYYVFLLLPLYEFIPLLFALAGIGYYLVRLTRQQVNEGTKEPHLLVALFTHFLLYWSALGLILYSWIGEKMPWLVLHPALPLTLLAGRFIGDVFESADWAEIQRRGGLILAILLVPTLLVLSVWIRLRPFQGMSLQKLGQTMRWLASLAVLAFLVMAVIHYIQRLGARRTGYVAFATLLALLGILTVRYSWLANYVHPETAEEFLVYAHSTPDVPMVMREIESLSRRLVGDKGIKVAYDDDSTWPLEWYFRDYPHRAYYGSQPSKDALDAPVVIVGPKNEGKVKPYLGDRYTRREYRLIWWPIEDYKGLTPRKFMEWLRDPVERKRIWNIVFHRRYDTPLNAWPFVHRFALYVRKDVVAQIWEYGAETVGPMPEVEDEYAKRRVQLSSVLAWGSQGAGDGQLFNPKGVAVDKAGYIYVVDSGNHRVQRFDAQGRFIAKWGSQGASPGQFQEPWGIAVDDGGHVYVADTWNHRVQKFDQDGRFLLQWGTFGDTRGELGQGGVFYGPRDIAIDGEGNLYVTDTGNKRVQKFSPEGEFLGQWGGGGVDAGQFQEPVGIAISERSGDIFIADTWNRRIQRFDRDFNFIAQWPVQGWESESVVNKPYLALDSADNIYVTDPENYRILKFNSKGELMAVWGEFGMDSRSFNLPTGIAVDGADNVYAVDSFNHRAMKFEPVK